MLVRNIFETNSSSACEIIVTKSEEVSFPEEFIETLEHYQIVVPPLDKLKPAIEDGKLVDELTETLDDEDLDFVTRMHRAGYNIWYHQDYLGFLGHTYDNLILNWDKNIGIILFQGCGDY